MNDNNNGQTGGISFLGLLFIVFLVLKLGVGNTSVVNWSWWWVTAPLWGMIPLVLVIVTIVFVIAFIAHLLK